MMLVGEKIPVNGVESNNKGQRLFIAIVDIECSSHQKSFKLFFKENILDFYSGGRPSQQEVFSVNILVI